MRVLVLGGGGFIGSALAKHLAKKKGFSVQVVDTFSHGFPSKPVASRGILPPISGNIANYYDLIRPFERFAPEAVVVLAAPPNRPESINDFRLCANVNYVGIMNLLHACLVSASRPSRIVFASTLDADDPISHTGISKGAAEQAIRYFSSTFEDLGVQSVILRLGEVYGYNLPFSSTALVNFLVTNMLRQMSLCLYDVTAKLDNIHLNDVVRAFDLALTSKLTVPHVTMDIGTGQGRELKELVELIAHKTKYKGELKYLVNPRTPLRDLIADTRAAKKVLGFVAKEDFDKQVDVLIRKRKRDLKNA